MIEMDPKGNGANKLIVTIVKKGLGSKVVLATKQAGVRGGTILYGRGTQNKNLYLQMLGINFDPEREIILTVVAADMADSILELITQTASLNKPGYGIAFMLDIKNISGIVQMINK